MLTTGDTDFQKSFGRRELVESEGAYIDDDPGGQTLVDFYYHGLNPNDQRLFEDITGYQGKPTMNNQQLMNKYRLTQGQLSYRKRKFEGASNAFYATSSVSGFTSCTSSER